MADITGRLVWYRLVETYKSAADAWEISTSGGSEAAVNWLRRVDVLDMLFVGWLVAALIVIGAINIYLRWFGRGRHGSGVALVGKGVSGFPSGKLDFTWGEGRSGETVRWVNAAVAWFSEQQQNAILIDVVLRALSEEAKKLKRSDMQVRFDSAERTNKSSAASSSIQFSNVTTDVTEDNQLLKICADVNVSDVSLVVSAVFSTVTNFRAIPCDVRLQRLTGTVQCQVVGETASITFQSPPDFSIEVIPSVLDLVDKPVMEATIRESIKSCKMELHLPAGGIASWQAALSTTGHSSAHPSMHDEVDRCLEPEVMNMKVSEQFRQPRRERSRRSDEVLRSERRSATSSANMARERRVLVKVIKANGLMNKDFAGSCDPYCKVSVDDPPQYHQTSVVKNTINPFFDENFVFNLNSVTKQVNFEVYDRSKSQGSDEFLGRASVVIDDLRRLPSSRQIIPLTGRTSSMTTTSGSITAEFLLLEATINSGEIGQSNSMMETMGGAVRHIESNQFVTAEGTVITTTTTTTDRVRDSNAQPSYNGSPLVVEKSRMLTTHPPQNSPYSTSVDLNNRQGNFNSLENRIPNSGITEVALQELTSQQRSGIQPKSTTITLSGKARSPAVPVIKTTQAPYDLDGGSTLQSNATTSDLKDVKKKSSLASAIKKRFSRSKDKKDRCQSVDRLGSFRSDGGDSTLLRPPNQADAGSATRITDSADGAIALRTSRSHSLSASFRNLFSRSKSKSRGGGVSNGVSRESSVSRSDLGPYDGGSVMHTSPQLSTTSQHQSITDRQQTPSPPTESSLRIAYPYSTSVPARVSPLAQQ